MQPDKTATTKTDAPLKIILADFAKEFAALALGDKFKVLDARLLDKEQFQITVPKKQEMDAWLETTVEDTHGIVSQRRLHLEFQGRGSHQAMEVRVFNYFAVATRNEGTLQVPVDIVVFYIGGAGKDDNGKHILGDPPIGEFTYHTIHLNEWQASDMLKSNNPLLIALIGLSKLNNPQAEVEAAYHKIIELSPKEDQAKYLNGMKMLLPNNTLVERIEELMAQQGLLMDTPYMLRIQREKQEQYDLGLAKGEAKGRAEGKAEGRAEGKAEGRAEGEAKGKILLREHIENILLEHFDPSAKNFKVVQKQLEEIDGYTTLTLALQQAVTLADFAAFMHWLAEVSEKSDDADLT